MSRKEEQVRREVMTKIGKEWDRDRPLPPTFKFLIHQQVHKRFTWKERLQIFLGWAIVADVKIACLHNPDARAAKWEITLTAETDPEQEIRK